MDHLASPGSLFSASARKRCLPPSQCGREGLAASVRDPDPAARAAASPDHLTAVARLIFDAPAMLVWIDGQNQGGLDPATNDSFGNVSAGGLHRTSVGEMTPPDTASSPNLAGQLPINAGRHLPFHAAAPLYAADTKLVGLLHIALQAARPLGSAPEDRRRLETLAGIAAEVVDLRQRLYLAEEALAEKDLLAREADHRVANGLQMIHGTLSLQAAAETGTAQGAALRAAAARIAAVASAHRHLHSTAAEAPDAVGYITALVHKIAAPPTTACGTAGAEGRPVVLATAAVSKAIPAGLLPRLGLIAAELVANTLKHGAGRVLVELGSAPTSEGGGVVLAVSDEGPGFPLGFEPAAPGRTGLGMRLIVALSRPGGVGIDPEDRRRIVVRLIDRAIPATSQ